MHEYISMDIMKGFGIATPQVSREGWIDDTGDDDDDDVCSRFVGLTL